MTRQPQVVTAQEAIDHLVDIVEKHGDIPVIVHRADHNAVESIGCPVAVSVTPAGSIDGFQAYDYTPRQDGQTMAVLIH